MVTATDIRVARARLNEDRATFAARFGIDRATLSRWERKGVPAKGSGQKVAEYVLAELAVQSSEAAE
jgi:DNA-binding transcriptional regulator YiaG